MKGEHPKWAEGWDPNPAYEIAERQLEQIDGRLFWGIREGIKSMSDNNQIRLVKAKLTLEFPDDPDPSEMVAALNAALDAARDASATIYSIGWNAETRGLSFLGWGQGPRR